MVDLATKLKDDEEYIRLASDFLIAEEERSVAMSRSRISFIKRDKFTWLLFCEAYYHACQNVIERGQAVDAYVKTVWENQDAEKKEEA
jgi:hypothetical protein